MRLNKTIKKQIFFTTIITLIFSVSYLLSEFIGIPTTGIKDILTITAQWGIVTLATWGIIHVLASHKYLFVFTFPFVVIACSLLTYFRYASNITLTSTIIDLVFTTDLKTDFELLSVSLVLFLCYSAIFAALAIYYRTKMDNSNMIINLISGVMIIAILTNYKGTSSGISNRMPYSLFYSGKRYIQEKKNISATRMKISKDAHCGEDALTVVVVIGESLRADHLSLNGYHRNTTPLLKKRTNLVSYPHMYTEEIYTHLSIPHILTRADSMHKDLAYTEESFISVFHAAGYKTYWLTNQETLENFAPFMKESDSIIYKNSGKNDYIFNKWTDDVLFEDYNRIVGKDTSNKLLVLHCVGSHWWYNSHFPKDYEIFRPVTESKLISYDKKDRIINSYDNTVIFTDYVLNTLITKLENKNAVLLYVSDHGELLGEHGNFIRTADYPPAHNSAFFVWFSEEYKHKHPTMFKELIANKNKKLRTDIVFHSVLQAGQIKSPFINPSLSIFSSH